MILTLILRIDLISLIALMRLNTTAFDHLAVAYFFGHPVYTRVLC